MKVMVGCEFSGITRDAFASLGHDAWSCDLLPTERPGKHIQGDVMDNIYGWDLLILHPPCTKIGLCGNGTYGRGKPRHQERIAALDWTENLWREATGACGHVALEQPRSTLCQRIGKRTQEIQPWQFWHTEQKATWLWLHGLPKLAGTHNVYDKMMRLPKSMRERIFYMSPSMDRGHEQSRSYEGIAKAMAEQWGAVEQAVTA